MKAKLQLIIVCHVGSREEGFLKEPHICLTKNFDLPFAPYVGLDLRFPSINDKHPDWDTFKELSRKATELISFFEIDSLYYDVGESTFYLTSYLNSQRKDGKYPHFRTLEEGQIMARILIAGYGFSPQFDIARRLLSLPPEL